MPSSYVLSRCRAVCRRAFTLSELLVALGIIAILLALLLPVAGSARRHARTVTCASNLRQVHVAATSWNASHRPTRLAAIGWMEQLIPHLGGDRSVYKCPESELELVTLDSAGKWEKTPAPTTPSTPSAPTSSKMPPSLDDAYVTITAGETWDVPVKEGPWFKKSNVTENSYDLWLEDAGFLGGGDQDFQDVGLRITDKGDGSTVIELLARSPGKFSSFGSALKASTPNGPKTLMSDLYKGGSQAGALALFLTPPDNPASGSDNGGDGSGGGGTMTFRPGSGAPADYAFSARAELVFAIPAKVYAIDYVWSVADPDTDNWSQPQWQTGGGETIVIGRHRGGANILYGDGSVVLNPVSGSGVNPGFADNKPNHWEP